MKTFKTTALFAAVFLYIFTFNSCKSYPPAFEVNQFYTDSNDKVIFIDEASYIAIMPKNQDQAFTAESAIIFYPGGLVDYHSYLPLMTDCAEHGAACFIVKMPLNFAFMNKNAAGNFVADHPEIKNWYLAGHSLGGAMAASYISEHTEDFKGLILLAAFSTRDISDSNLKVLSIYGSNDGILNLEKYNLYKKNLPPSGKGLTEIVLDGGNHAHFASYGEQKGDGKADITPEEQQKATAAEIIQWAGLK